MQGLSCCHNYGKGVQNSYCHKRTHARTHMHEHTHTQLWGLLWLASLSLWRSSLAAALLLESLLHICTSTIKSPLVPAIGVRLPHVARLFSAKQMVRQCKTYDRSCVSLFPNCQTLTWNTSLPGQAHEIGVQLRRQIMGQQLPARGLSTVSSCPFALSVAAIDIL